MKRAFLPWRSVIALFAFVSWCPSVVALRASLDISQYAHTAWKIRDGFPSGYAEALAQTPDGYLWLGTEFGLIRFDGVRHVSWQPPPGRRLPSNQIRALLVARDGSLWIGTRKGLARWANGELTEYAEFSGEDVISMIEGKDGTIWVGGRGSSRSRLCSIRSTNVECHGEDGSLGEFIQSLYEDRASDIWFATRNKLWRWRNETSLTQFSIPGEPAIHVVLGDESGGLLVGTSGGLFRWANGTVEDGPMILGDITRVLRDRDGGLWVGTGDGLRHVRDERVDSYTQFHGLSSNTITAILEDHEGDVWVATLDGVDRFRDFAIPTISTAQGLPGRLFSVLASGDDIWMGTVGGLTRWKDGKLTNFRKAPDRTAPVHAQPLRLAEGNSVREVFDHALPDEQIHALANGEAARIWVSTRGGVSFFQDGGFVALPEIHSGIFHSIADDLTGGVWISHQTEGLIHWRQEGAIERFPWSTFRPDATAATSLLADRVHGGLWIGFAFGGIAHFRDGKVIASYELSDGLGGGLVASLHLDRDGTLWAATQGGLSRFGDGSIVTLTSSNGLPCDAVHWAIEDDAQSFWLGTACGVVRIARQELEAWTSDSKRRIDITVFDSADGVRNQAIPTTYTPIVAKSTEGKLWFVTFDGVSMIDPRQLPFNKLPPPVHVEQITADRKTYEASSQLRLPPLVRDLAIDYTALSFVAPEKNQFRYKLEGHDRDWVDAGNRRQAFYTDLDPGNYRFRVIASNNSGVWNEEGASLDFSITPAYWQTNWFRALCAATLIALLGALYLLRVRHLTRQFTMTLDARVNERTRIARELHDTLLQSFQGLLLRFQTVLELLPARAGEAKQLLAGTIDQASDAITEGRDAVEGLRASTTETNDLADAIRKLGEELAGETADSDVVLRIEVHGVSRNLHPIVRDEAFRIAGEAVRNAFRHAGAKQIDVELRYDARHLRVHVRDRGKGIDPKVLSEGGREGHYGMLNMRERARIIGGELTVWSALDAGTEVELTVPASRAYATSRSRFVNTARGEKAS